MTLVAAIATLVPPLEHRLGDRPPERHARAGAHRRARPRAPAARATCARGRPGRRRRPRPRAPDGRARRAARRPRRRAGRHRSRPSRAALGHARAPGRRGLRAGRRRPRPVSEGEAVVVAPVRTRAGRRTLVLRKSLDDSRAAAAVVRGALPVAGGVGLLVAAALGVALGFGLLRRLERLRRGARRLADEGIERAAGARRLPRRGRRAGPRPRDDALAAARRGARPPGLPGHRLARAAHAAGVAARHRRAAGRGARARRAGPRGGSPARRRSSAPDRPHDRPGRRPARPQPPRRQRAARRRAGRAARAGRHPGRRDRARRARRRRGHRARRARAGVGLVRPAGDRPRPALARWRTRCATGRRPAAW